MRVNSERQAIESAEERGQPTSMHPAAYSWVWCNMNTLTVAQARPTMHAVHFSSNYVVNAVHI